MKLVTKNIDRYISAGIKDRYWYEETRQVIERLMPGEDINLFIDVLCATSINSTLKSNVTKAVRQYWNIVNGLPTSGDLPAMIYQIELVRQGLPLHGRKVLAFSKAMKGDPDAVVVDVWLCRAFGIDSEYFNKQRGATHTRSPSKREYETVERYVRRYAKRNGFQAREASSMIWSGIRMINTGKDNTTRFDHALQMKLGTLFPLFAKSIMTDTSPMPFGKYKGKEMVNVPADYLIYLHDQGNLYGDLLQYIEDNLEVLKQQADKIKQDYRNQQQTS